MYLEGRSKIRRDISSGDGDSHCIEVRKRFREVRFALLAEEVHYSEIECEAGIAELRYRNAGL